MEKYKMLMLKSCASNLSFRHVYLYYTSRTTSYKYTDCYLSRLEFGSFSFFPQHRFTLMGTHYLQYFFFCSWERWSNIWQASIPNRSMIRTTALEERRHGSLELISFRSHFVNRLAFLLFFFFRVFIFVRV